jgi:hypothetical protein
VTTVKAETYHWQTREERKRLAERLYGDGWTMQRIAEALRVSQPTIARDLAQFIPTNNPARPKGGRPKEGGSQSLFTNNPAPAATNKPAPVANKPTPAAVAESDQQTKPVELQEDSLKHYQARVRFYSALAWYQGMRAAYFQGMLEGRTGATSEQLEQRVANSRGVEEYADKVEAAYEEVAEWEEGEEEDIALLMPEVRDENQEDEDEDDDSPGPREIAFIDEIWKEARKTFSNTHNPIMVPELVDRVMKKFSDANQGLVATEFIDRCHRARGITWKERLDQKYLQGRA